MSNVEDVRTKGCIMCFLSLYILKAYIDQSGLSLPSFHYSDFL